MRTHEIKIINKNDFSMNDFLQLLNIAKHIDFHAHLKNNLH